MPLQPYYILGEPSTPNSRSIFHSCAHPSRSTSLSPSHAHNPKAPKPSNPPPSEREREGPAAGTQAQPATGWLPRRRVRLAEKAPGGGETERTAATPPTHGDCRLWLDPPATPVVAEGAAEVHRRRTRGQVAATSPDLEP